MNIWRTAQKVDLVLTRLRVKLKIVFISKYIDFWYSIMHLFPKLKQMPYLKFVDLWGKWGMNHDIFKDTCFILGKKCIVEYQKSIYLLVKTIWNLTLGLTFQPQKLNRFCQFRWISLYCLIITFPSTSTHCNEFL